VTSCSSRWARRSAARIALGRGAASACGGRATAARRALGRGAAIATRAARRAAAALRAEPARRERAGVETVLRWIVAEMAVRPSRLSYTESEEASGSKG